MNIKVSKNLIELSRIFSKIAPLYIVGGYVRNAILNNYETDVDIASSLSMEQILSILSGTQYLVKIKSAKMGTLTISKGEEVYEHTTFRTDNYSLDGSHSPLNVFFNATIKEDASRRDFKCNTIYYDILHKKIIDFYGELSDINNKIFSCIETPEKVFSSDGLRLLRLVRQSSELNFSIENNTFISAKNFAKNLSKIVGERKSRELDLILNSDVRYSNLSNQNSVINGLNNLTKLDLWKYLFNNKNYTYDFDYENFYSLKCNKDLRLEAFITEIYFHINAQNIIEPKKFCNLFLGGKGLNFSKKEQIRVLEIY
jgi:tRNA nucleotidyltransferase (CCA-adding enzyme)